MAWRAKWNACSRLIFPRLIPTAVRCSSRTAIFSSNSARTSGGAVAASCVNRADLRCSICPSACRRASLIPRPRSS
ncbi:hypothetical protein ACFWAY_10455 [Rhodococcus sp. NPDC059968]|uniref:hypothetical protein n=1 Tax=Rhodococcus sp. NPDC059968 TaxID=3347017 RepID=UPI00366CDBC4